MFSQNSFRKSHVRKVLEPSGLNPKDLAYLKTAILECGKSVASAEKKIKRVNKVIPSGGKTEPSAEQAQDLEAAKKIKTSAIDSLGEDFGKLGLTFDQKKAMLSKIDKIEAKLSGITSLAPPVSMMTGILTAIFSVTNYKIAAIVLGAVCAVNTAAMSVAFKAQNKADGLLQALSSAMPGVAQKLKQKEEKTPASPSS